MISLTHPNRTIVATFSTGYEQRASTRRINERKRIRTDQSLGSRRRFDRTCPCKRPSFDLRHLRAERFESIHKLAVTTFDCLERRDTRLPFCGEARSNERHP